MDNVTSSTITGSSRANSQLPWSPQQTESKFWRWKQNCTVSVTCALSSETIRLNSHGVQEKYSKQNLTSLKAIFPVNPVNSQFSGYTLRSTFASQKTDFTDFFDNACELSLLTTLILNFHIDTTFIWHMNTWFQQGQTTFSEWGNCLVAILLKRCHLTINLGEA